MKRTKTIFKMFFSLKTIHVSVVDGKVVETKVWNPVAMMIYTLALHLLWIFVDGWRNG